MGTTLSLQNEVNICHSTGFPFTTKLLLSSSFRKKRFPAEGKCLNWLCWVSKFLVVHMCELGTVRRERDILYMFIFILVSHQLLLRQILA